MTSPASTQRASPGAEVPGRWGSRRGGDASCSETFLFFDLKLFVKVQVSLKSVFELCHVQSLLSLYLIRDARSSQWCVIKPLYSHVSSLSSLVDHMALLVAVAEMLITT